MKDRDDLQRAFREEQNEGAIADGIEFFKNKHMPASIEIRGMYESLLEVGFDDKQAISIVITELQLSRR